jgi:hypothetical protein
MSLPPNKRESTWTNPALAIEYDGLYLLCEQQQVKLAKCAEGKAAVREEIEAMEIEMEKQLQRCHNAKEDLQNELDNSQATVYQQEEELRNLRAQPFSDVQPSSDIIDDMLKAQKDLIAERDHLQEQLELLQIELMKCQSADQGRTCACNTTSDKDTYQAMQSEDDVRHFGNEEPRDYQTLHQAYTVLLQTQEKDSAKHEQCMNDRHFLQQKLSDSRKIIEFMENAQPGDNCRRKCSELQQNCEDLVQERNDFRDRLCKLLKAIEFHGEAVRKLAKEVMRGVDCSMCTE